MNYKIPLDFYGFFQKIEMSNNKKQAHFDPLFQKVDKLKESIDDFLDLLIFTHPRECSFFQDFGFVFWDSQFNNISIEHFNNTENPRKDFEESLRNSILTYETRLENVRVEILLTNQAITSTNKSAYSVIINISGMIKTLPAEPYHKSIVFSSDSMKRK